MIRDSTGILCDIGNAIGLVILAREFRNDKVSFVRVLMRIFCNLGFDVPINFFSVQKNLIVRLECFGVDPLLFGSVGWWVRILAD